MKRWIRVTAVIFALCCAITLTSCSNQPITAAEGLDLHAVATLVEQARDGEHFEQTLNTSGINNLDLDGDGHVDYLSVKEYGDGDFRGFSLSTTLAGGSVQQIAEIQFQRGLNGINLNIHGNPQIYGPNYYIRPAHPLTLSQVMFLRWLYSPRVVFMSPYNRLYLPPTYSIVRVVPVTTYRTVTTTTIKTAGFQMQQVQKPTITPTIPSPNEGKSSAAVVAPLKAPTATQKEFQARPETKQMQKAIGFVKKDGTSTPALPPQAVKPNAATPPAPAPAGTKPLAAPVATDKPPVERDTARPMRDATGFAPEPQVNPLSDHQATPPPPAPTPQALTPRPTAPQVVSPPRSPALPPSTPTSDKPSPSPPKKR